MKEEDNLSRFLGLVICIMGAIVFGLWQNNVYAGMSFFAFLTVIYNR